MTPYARRLALGLALALPVLALAAPAPVTRTGDHNHAWYTENLVRMDVLDVNADKGLAAVKFIEKKYGDMERSPFDCAYPGMKDFPEAGVRLALWDLRAHKIVQEWTVYAAALDASGCSPAPKNEANLAAAKAKFAEVGLDVTKKPAPVQPKDGSYTLTVGGKTVTVTAKAEGGTATLSLGSTPFYTTTWPYDEGGAFGAEHFEFGAAYVIGTKVVFVEDNNFTTMRSSDRWMGLSPAFDLGS